MDWTVFFTALGAMLVVVIPVLCGQIIQIVLALRNKGKLGEIHDDVKAAAPPGTVFPSEELPKPAGE